MNFIVSNQENCEKNSSVDNMNTTDEHYFHRPSASLSFSKKCILCWHHNCKCLLHSLKILMNEKTKFKVVLRNCLNTHSFYSVVEFFYA